MATNIADRYQEQFMTQSNEDLQSVIKRLETKHNKRSRRNKVYMTIGMLAAATAGLWGVKTLNEITYSPSDNQREAAIVKTIETSGKSSDFRIYHGTIGLMPGATIRENPMVVEDNATGETNKVDPGHILKDYKYLDSIMVKNPIFVEDEINIANGMWAGFMVYIKGEYHTYWTNEQNILVGEASEPNRKNPFVKYNGQSIKNIGVVNIAKPVESPVESPQ
ncbi:MAG: hypothetical protein WCP03_01525 [Candidatus Saccharibacteria bacterium]